MADTKKPKLGKFETMQKLYLTLAAVQRNTIFRVTKGNPKAEEVVTRAEKEIEALQSLVGEAPGGRTCPAGQIWDEYLGKCV